MDDFIATITRTQIFAGLSREDLARVAGQLEEVSVKPGEAIIRQGDPGDALYCSGGQRGPAPPPRRL